MGTLKPVRCSVCGSFMGKLPASDDSSFLVCKSCQQIEGKKPRRKRGGDMRPSFECPRCKAVTHNAHDIDQSYCPKCKIFYRASLFGLKRILTSMQNFKSDLITHGDGLITATEFNTLIAAIHDMQVLLEGVLKHERERSE